MLPKLCSLLAIALLLAVLACGNPFLARRAAVPPSNQGAPPRVPDMATEATSEVSAEPLCPDPQLRAEVVEVLFAADGTPRWRLRDGRLMHDTAEGVVEFVAPAAGGPDDRATEGR